MNLKLISFEDRKNKRCYFCDTEQSVKYIVCIHDPVIGPNMHPVYCCNKCVMFYMRREGDKLPLVREIEPPAAVYKKCLNGVIVIETIPEDAQIRGTKNGKCRANKAIITNVLGDLHGEPVGISWHDLKTMYYAGDIVHVQDFAFNNEKYAPGFHFFCTQEEAEEY